MSKTTEAITTPNGWEDTPPAKRSGHKGLLPLTWLNRELKVEYVGADGSERSTTGTLLDIFPFGPILAIDGARVALNWDRLALVELAED